MHKLALGSLLLALVMLGAAGLGGYATGLAMGAYGGGFLAPAPSAFPPAARETGGTAPGTVSVYVAAYLDMRRILHEEHPRLDESTADQIAAAIATETYALGIDPWLVFAVIGVESRFDADARGAAGEIGLMQPLPATARLVARRLYGIEAFDTAALYDPHTNIRIAGGHLAALLSQYDADPVKALAAYNAGRPGSTAGMLYAYRVLGQLARLEDHPVRVAAVDAGGGR